MKEEGKMRVKKKPVIVDAFRWDGTLETLNRLRNLGVKMVSYVTETSVHSLVISSLEGEELVGDGDWIVKGIKGEFYPVRSDIFELTYEVIEE